MDTGYSKQVETLVRVHYAGCYANLERQFKIIRSLVSVMGLKSLVLSIDCRGKSV
jgi:hypothetical protein